MSYVTVAPGSATTRSGSPGAGFRPGAILAFVWLGRFMVVIDVTIVNPALLSIEDGLDMSGVRLKHIVTAYATVLGGLLLLSGRLAGTFGRRPASSGLSAARE